MFDTESMKTIAFSMPPLLLSIVLHEVAHARTALSFGDPTAHRLGRTSLNPLVHLDPIGTLALFFIGFGWAKPVPIDPRNLHPPRLGNIMVSLAGPLSNLGLAVVCGLVLKILYAWPGLHNFAGSDMLINVLFYTFAVNVVLCVFNLVPLFPLDGHHILRELLPYYWQAAFMRWQVRFGMLTLMALLFGPRLLGGFLKQPVPNPISLVIGQAIGLLDALI